jgi:hypothetical protein
MLDVAKRNGTPKCATRLPFSTTIGLWPIPAIPAVAKDATPSSKSALTANAAMARRRRTIQDFGSRSPSSARIARVRDQHCQHGEPNREVDDRYRLLRALNSAIQAAALSPSQIGAIRK